MRHFKLAAIAAIILVSVAASPAWAVVECKADQIIGVSAPGGTQPEAQSSWVTFVTAQFGADWANVSLATNQTTNPLNLNDFMWDIVGIANGGPAMFGAIPCREVPRPHQPYNVTAVLAHVECKAQFIGGSGKDIRAARSAWTTSVSRKYGAEWANADASRYVAWQVAGARDSRTFSLHAVPCRPDRGPRAEPKPVQATPHDRG